MLAPDAGSGLRSDDLLRLQLVSHLLLWLPLLLLWPRAGESMSGSRR
jgi:hypothetical protein